MNKKTSEISLAEVNSSIKIPGNSPFWKKALLFSGPGALVAVGYMDPGNWITSIDGGANFAYSLLFIVLLSSVMAMILQSMASKLGIITEMDLAQATRKYTSKNISFILWILTELAIIATDIAEIIGSAIALQLLFGIPLLLGVIITVFDVFLLLILIRFGFRKIEAIVFTLIIVIMGIFLYEVILADPSVKRILMGYIPSSTIIHNESALLLSLGIIGATVMPHNLYLHSSISQTRKINRKNKKELKEAVKLSRLDSNIQLSFAFIINSLLLILGAALFFGDGHTIGTFQDIYNSLSDPAVVGAIASSLLATLFAVALLASGQNSTITGTLTGQVIMEGFLHIHIQPWLRRLITRLIAVTPVILTILIYGDDPVVIDNVLIYSQVFLSIALPFSIIPLTIFTSSEKIMGKEFVNSKLTKYIAWIISILLTILNLQLIFSTLF